MRFNFEKYSRSEINNHGVKYDYDSVMHYGAYDFAKQAGLKTIQTLRNGVKIGDKPKLSPMDVKQAKLLYRCKKGNFENIFFSIAHALMKCCTPDIKCDLVWHLYLTSYSNFTI